MNSSQSRIFLVDSSYQVIVIAFKILYLRAWPNFGWFLNCFVKPQVLHKFSQILDYKLSI